jgi:hypothetical protein
LSFLGVDFGSLEVSRVRITNGNAALGPVQTSSVDLVVMDDFIYGEPSLVPGPHRRCRIARSHIGWWWPARLVAAAAENRLNAKIEARRACADGLNRVTCSGSELGWQVAVDLESDANLDERRGHPGHLTSLPTFPMKTIPWVDVGGATGNLASPSQAGGSRVPAWCDLSMAVADAVAHCLPAGRLTMASR